MPINLTLPQTTQELRPKITVVGVGGAGCNAVNNMINANREGVDFLVVNTDEFSESFEGITLATVFCSVSRFNISNIKYETSELLVHENWTVDSFSLTDLPDIQFSPLVGSDKIDASGGVGSGSLEQLKINIKVKHKMPQFLILFIF